MYLKVQKKRGQENMARERVVTRTVTSTRIEVLCMDVTSASVVIKEFDVTPSTDNQALALKMAQKLYDTDTFKLVSINKMSQCEQIYGMLEIDFMKFARLMDSDRHFIGEPVDDTEDVPLDDTEDVPVDDTEDVPVDKNEKKSKRK